MNSPMSPNENRLMPEKSGHQSAYSLITVTRAPS